MGVGSASLACWKKSSLIANDKQKGFFTWPYYATGPIEQEYKSSADWALDIINECARSTTIHPSTVTSKAANTNGIFFLSTLAVLIFQLK